MTDASGSAWAWRPWDAPRTSPPAAAATSRPTADPALVVASTWGYRHVGAWRTHAEVHEVKDHSLSAFREQLGESRAHLGDHLAVHQVHSVTPDSPVLHDGELLRALAEQRDRGLRIGLSTSGPQQADVVREALDVVVGGARRRAARTGRGRLGRARRGVRGRRRGGRPPAPPAGPRRGAGAAVGLARAVRGR